MTESDGIVTLRIRAVAVRRGIRTMLDIRVTEVGGEPLIRIGFRRIRAGIDDGITACPAGLAVHRVNGRTARILRLADRDVITGFDFDAASRCFLDNRFDDLFPFVGNVVQILQSRNVVRIGFDLRIQCIEIAPGRVSLPDVIAILVNDIIANHRAIRRPEIVVHILHRRQPALGLIRQATGFHRNQTICIINIDVVITSIVLRRG